jgi:hypothetical protein
MIQTLSKEKLVKRKKEQNQKRTVNECHTYTASLNLQLHRDLSEKSLA